MNYISIIFGSVLILLGCFTAVMRRRGFSHKLDAMQNAFGPRGGLAMHWIFYTLIPVVYGVVSVMLGLQGKSFF